jgi:hypothetical protein
MTVVQVDDEDRIGGAYLPRASSGSPDGKTPASDVALSPEHTRQVSPLRNVALRGKLTADGYIPENWSWLDHLTKPDDEMGRVNSRGELRRIGRDPMTIPLDVLNASGHSQRPTRVLVRSIETALELDLSDYGMREYRDLRHYCLDCSNGVSETRRCAVINCPIWPYRMGRNPHNPKRGTNPFKAWR